MRCSICRRVLLAGHSFADGRVVCDTDVRRPGCTFCGFPATHRLDEYLYCDECRGRAVVDETGVAFLTRAVEASMRRHNIWLAKAVPVQLETLATQKAARAYDPHVWGRTRFTSGVRGSTTSIEIRFGLPQEIMLSTIAHEYGHVLLFANRRFSLSAELTEGFCEYLAHETLADHSLTPAAHRYRQQMVIRKDVYGNGLRTMLRLAGAYGRARLTTTMLSGDLRSVGL